MLFANHVNLVFPGVTELFPINVLVINISNTSLDELPRPNSPSSVGRLEQLQTFVKIFGRQSPRTIPLTALACVLITFEQYIFVIIRKSVKQINTPVLTIGLG